MLRSNKAASFAIMMVSLPAFHSTAYAQTMDYGALEQLFGEPVTTSATGKPQKASEAPVNMEIVTADDIRRSGATSIPEALRNVPGLDVWQMQSTNYSVGVRGMNSTDNPRLLVLVNGRQVYLDHYGMTDWSAIPVQIKEIRQIEVVKGPNTALFGFNAAQGVVNIVTYNPLYDNVNNATATLGTGGTKGISAIKTFKFGEKGGLRVSGGGFTTDAFDARGNYTAGIDAPYKSSRLRSFNADGLFEVADKTQFGIEASYSNPFQSELLSVTNFTNTQYNTNSIKMFLTKDSDFGLLEASVYRNNSDVLAKSVTLDSPQSVTVWKLQDLFKIGTDHTIRIASEYRNNTMDTTPKGAASSFGYNVYSGSTMWDWAITDAVSWTNAARLDHLVMNRSGFLSAEAATEEEDFRRNITEWSANSGLVWKATDKDSFMLAYARGMQIPSLLQLGALSGGVPGFYYGGDPSLNPTIITNYELAYTRTLTPFTLANHTTASSFKTAVFYQTIKDVNGFAYGMPDVFKGTAINYLYENVGDTKTTGVELSYKATIGDNWRFNTSYIYQTADDSFNPNPASPNLPFDQNFEDSTAHHIANLNLGYSKNAWEADTFLHYASDREMLRQDSTTQFYPASLHDVGAYLSLAGRVGYKLTDKINLSVTGQNIQAEHTQQTSAPDVERRVLGQVSVNF